jgi:hypothetical protein
MIFELDQIRQGDWDRFQIRNIGFAVQRLMATRFNGDGRRTRTHAADFVRDTFGINNVGDFAVVLMLIDDLKAWSEHDHDLLKRILEAKTNGTEAMYLKLCQRHSKLREAIIRMGK